MRTRPKSRQPAIHPLLLCCGTLLLGLLLGSASLSRAGHDDLSPMEHTAKNIAESCKPMLNALTVEKERSLVVNTFPVPIWMNVNDGEDIPLVMNRQFQALKLPNLSMWDADRQWDQATVKHQADWKGITITVRPFGPDSAQTGPSAEGKDLAEKLAALLAQTPPIHVAESTQLQNLLEYIRTTNSGLYQNSVEVGKLIHSDYIVIGSLTKAGERGWAVDARIMDIATGLSRGGCAFESTESIVNLARQLRDKLVPFLQITRPEQHFERPDMICMGYLMRCRHKSMVIARIVNAATGGLETAALATVPETACTVENTKEDVLDKMMWAETALNAATEAAKKLEADLAQLPASDTPGKTPTIRINKLTSRSNNDYFGFEDAVLNGVLAQIGQHRSEKYRILDPFASEVDVSNQPGGESASDLNKMLDTIRTSLAPADYYLKISVQVQQKGHQIDPVTGERSKVKDTATVDLSLSRRKDGRIFGVKNGTAILTNY